MRGLLALALLPVRRLLALALGLAAMRLAAPLGGRLVLEGADAERRSGTSGAPSEITGLYSPSSDSKTCLPVFTLKPKVPTFGPRPAT